MSGYEVPQPIITSPYDEPTCHWDIREGEVPVQKPQGRPADYFYLPRAQRGQAGRGTTNIYINPNPMSHSMEFDRSKNIYNLPNLVSGDKNYIPTPIEKDWWPK